MQKLIIVTLMLVALCASGLFAQSRFIWVNEDFSSPTFPPAGWTISEHAANWSSVQGAAAGGTAPEARLNWSPQFNGSTYLISPQYDTTGETTVYVDFDHFLDWYTNPFTIGLATRSNNGAWNVAFSQNPTANVGPQRKTVAINNADVGSSTFQFALFFSGNSYNLDYWYIDNVKLYTPFEYDLAVTEIPGEEHLETGQPLMPSCVVKNVGLGTLTASVSLDIFQNQTLLASYPGHVSYSLNPGAQQTATFPQFTPSVLNELYRFVYSVSSLEDVVDGDPSNNSKTKTCNTWTTAKQNVLLEIGTGGWCPYCPGAAMAADDFIDGGYNVAVIENHNGDPYATDTSNGRNAYYGISGYPTGIFDGLLSYVGGNNTTSVFPSYLPLYEQRAPIKTPITLSMYGNLNTRENYNVTVQINKLANLAYPNLVLHLCVTESNIPYNWQGQTEFNFVNRIMVPDMNGTTVDLMNSPLGVLNVPLTFAVDPAWQTGNCEFVVFVQNIDTKEVLQTHKVALIDLPENPVSIDDPGTPSLQTALLGNYPNPFNPNTTIRFSLKDNAPVSVEIYNHKGQKIKTLVNEAKEAGTHSATWNGTDENGLSVASGIYYFKMNSGKFSSTKKMILMK